MKRLIYTIVLLTGLLAACNQGMGPAPTLESLALTFDDIRWLTTDNPQATFKTVLGQNCMANALNTPGQGFRAQGTDGGLTYSRRSASTLGITSANKVGQTVKGLLTSPQRNMTLLVIDDFRSGGVPSNGVYAPKPELFTQTSLTAATLGQLQANKKLSHGALVLQHTLDAIKGTGFYPFSASPNPGVTVFRTTNIIVRTTRFLTVRAVDTGLSSTSIIANSVKSSAIATKLIPRLDATAGTVVINMSFALLPCEAYADFVQWDKITPNEQRFEEYIDALAVKNEVTEDALINVIVEATNDANDPLNLLIQKNWFRNVFVAASGNYGFNGTALYPAKWPGVIEVTGSVANNISARNSNFNKGDIMDIAGSLQLTASNFTLLPGAKNVYYKGTSFSTPSVSVYSALDLASQRRCTQVVTTTNGAVIFPWLAINLQNVVDKPLADAISGLCPVP